MVQFQSYAQLIPRTLVPNFLFDVGYNNRTVSSNIPQSNFSSKVNSIQNIYGFTLGIGYNYNKYFQSGIMFTYQIIINKFYSSSNHRSNYFEKTNTYGYQVSPFLRYYFPNENRFTGYVEVNYAFGKSSYVADLGNKIISQNQSYNLKTGVQYNIKNVGIDFGVNLFSITSIIESYPYSAQFRFNSNGFLISSTPVSLGIRYTI